MRKHVFSWEGWAMLCIVGQEWIPYLWEMEFYDIGLKEDLIKSI